MHIPLHHQRCGWWGMWLIANWHKKQAHTTTSTGSPKTPTHLASVHVGWTCLPAIAKMADIPNILQSLTATFNTQLKGFSWTLYWQKIKKILKHLKQLLKASNLKNFSRTNGLIVLNSRTLYTTVWHRLIAVTTHIILSVYRLKDNN